MISEENKEPKANHINQSLLNINYVLSWSSR